jgi:hypothetical protein
VLTRRGNLWPFSAAEITGIIECLDSDASFVRLDDEPAVFKKRVPTGELPACARTAPRP